jgi:hypothetical protein
MIPAVPEASPPWHQKGVYQRGALSQPLGTSCQSIKSTLLDDGGSRIESLLPRMALLTWRDGMDVKNKIKEAKDLASDLAKHAAVSAKEVAESQAAKELGAAAKDTAVDALKSDAVKQVAGAAAAGALAASVVPVVGTGSGAAIGAVAGAYKVFTK